MGCCEEIQRKINDLQHELDRCKNSPEGQISKIFSEAYKVETCEVAYSGSIKLKLDEGVNGNCALDGVYDIGYHISAIHSDGKQLTFKKNCSTC